MSNVRKIWALFLYPVVSQQTHTSCAITNQPPSATPWTMLTPLIPYWLLRYALTETWETTEENVEVMWREDCVMDERWTTSGWRDDNKNEFLTGCLVHRPEFTIIGKIKQKRKRGEWKGKGWCCLLKRLVLSCQPGHQRRSFFDNEKNNLCLAAEIWGFTFYQYLNLLLCRPWGFLSQWRWVCHSFDASPHDKKRAFK